MNKVFNSNMLYSATISCEAQQITIKFILINAMTDRKFYVAMLGPIMLTMLGPDMSTMLCPHL